MNIPKDGPDASNSGPLRQETAPKADEPGGISFPGQSDMAAPHEQNAGSAEDVADPMARLAEIIAQSPTTPVQAQPPAPVPIDAHAPIPAPAPFSASPSQQIAVPLPPPVAVPHIEVSAEDRSVAPVAARSGTRFALFRRSSSQKAAPTVAELAGSQTKKGFFARRAARRDAERAATLQSKRTARDKRYARRRRRVWFEELLGWIFVPVILIAIYYAAIGALAILGTTPEAVFQGLKSLRGHM